MLELNLQLLELHLEDMVLGALLQMNGLKEILRVLLPQGLK